jgi:hypothetical protein
VLGNHRLLCGDATVLADVERVLGGQLAERWRRSWRGCGTSASTST